LCEPDNLTLIKAKQKYIPQDWKRSDVISDSLKTYLGNAKPKPGWLCRRNIKRSPGSWNVNRDFHTMHTCKGIASSGFRDSGTSRMQIATAPHGGVDSPVDRWWGVPEFSVTQYLR